MVWFVAASTAVTEVQALAYEQRGTRKDACAFVAPATTIRTETCPAWVVTNERTPSVEPITPPETLFAIAWPQLHDAERARVLGRAQGELALRMAERMFAEDATRETAAWHLLQLERFVTDRAPFEAKLRAMIGKRAKTRAIFANQNLLTLAALAGDREARAAIERLVTDPVRTPAGLAFALRIAVRFDETVAAKLLAVVVKRPSLAAILRESPAIVRLVGETTAILDRDVRLELMSGGCSQASVDEIARTSHREAPAAIARVRACMKLRDALAPAFKAWVAVPSRR